MCALGIPRGIEEVELLCGTTSEGTSPRKLYRGLCTIAELDPQVLHETRKDVAVVLLEKALRDGRPVILLVENAEHWVSAIGLLGERVQIADGADNELVVSYPITEFANRWVDATSKRKPYYGIRM